MKKQILAVDFEKDKYEIAEKEWIGIGVGIQIVESLQTVMDLLHEEKEFTLIVICAKDKEYLKWLKKIRSYTIIPIFIMVSKQDDNEMSEALSLGADGYMERPKTVKASIAACQAHMRRFTEYCPKAKSCKSAYYADHIYLCIETRTLFVKEKKVDLTKTEFDLLHILIAKPKQAFEYEHLCKCLKRYEELQDPKEALKAHIKRLRGKLNDEETGTKYIANVYDVGYKFK